jgi:hypothetical protein
MIRITTDGIEENGNGPTPWSAMKGSLVAIPESGVSFSGNELTLESASSSLTTRDVSCKIRFVANASNTGALTVSIDGQAFVPLKYSDGTDLSSGALAVGTEYEISWDTAGFYRLTLTSTKLSSNTSKFNIVGGGADEELNATLSSKLMLRISTYYVLGGSAYKATTPGNSATNRNMLHYYNPLGGIRITGGRSDQRAASADGRVLIDGGSAAVGSGLNGSLAALGGGAADGTGTGGYAYLNGGSSDTGLGGPVYVQGGNTAGTAGTVYLVGGRTTSGIPGSIVVDAGVDANGAGSMLLAHVGDYGMSMSRSGPNLYWITTIDRGDETADGRSLTVQVGSGGQTGGDGGTLQMVAGNSYTSGDTAGALFLSSGNGQNGGGGGDATITTGLGEAATVTIRNRTAGEVVISTSDIRRWTVGATGNLAPADDNVYSMGTSANRVNTVYAGSSVIQTSDARYKTPVSGFSPQEISAAKAIAEEIGTYQFLAAIAKKGVDGARLHVGVTVQRIIEIMAQHGLDPLRYAFVCYDSWDETVIHHPSETESDTRIDITSEVDEDGNTHLSPRLVTTTRVVKEAWEETVPAGNMYSLRYDQLALFIASGLHAMHMDLQVRVAALETQP